MRKRDEQPAESPSSGPADEEATRAALKLLSIRARSSRELTQLLERKGFSLSARSSALEQVQRWGYVDDAQSAFDRATALLKVGKFGPSAVLMRLRARGFSEELAKSSVSKASEALNFNQRSAAQELLDRRKLGALSDPIQKTKATRLLRLRGFDDDVIEQLVGRDDP